MDLAVKLILAYLLGSVSGSLVLGRLRGIDIRNTGSGNAGGTNALRTQGKAFALAVIAIDIGKGALAAGWLPGLQLPMLGGESGPANISMLACSFAAVLGHVFPIFFGFKGGKGAATFVGASLVVLPLSVPILLVLWIAVVVLCGYVGLATVLAGLCYVALTVALAPEEGQWGYLTYAISGSALLLYTHRENMQRLLNGTENRFEKAMFWRKGQAD